MYIEICKYNISEIPTKIWYTIKEPYQNKSQRKMVDTYRVSRFPIEKFIKKPVDTFDITLYDLFDEESYYIEYYLKDDKDPMPKVLEVSDDDFEKYVHDIEELDVIYCEPGYIGYYPEDDIDYILNKWQEDEVFDNIILSKKELEELSEYVSDKDYFTDEILNDFEDGKHVVIIKYMED